MIHDLKCEAAHYREVEAGRKTAELRLNDRNYQVGDQLRLHETLDGTPTGRRLVRQVTHILAGGPWLSPGYVMLSLAMPSVPAALTKRQLAVMRMLTECMDASGTIPSMQEMADELELASRSNVHAILCRLEERGWISRGMGHARAIRILHRPPMPDWTQPWAVTDKPLPISVAAQMAGRAAE
ncbi:DUF3850 domain-containing protein [Nitrospirillum bahiense]|uniref:LexA DNA binding domain-containing protein n=1 Tax=Nitrospirillum amazonense TaxID=28077 RepID=A0A560F1Y0_9PROT|nr:DUF3850 domain-containing protein [Nitrospirillum amazonense]TWB15628.1 LexA DNA binding domain-containing protein [Nitrospirillum amazonense]